MVYEEDADDKNLVIAKVVSVINPIITTAYLYLVREIGVIKHSIHEGEDALPIHVANVGDVTKLAKDETIASTT